MVKEERQKIRDIIMARRKRNKDDVTRMYKYEGKSISEIVSELDISESAVRFLVKDIKSGRYKWS